MSKPSIPSTLEESQGGKLDPSYDYCLGPHRSVGDLRAAGWEPRGEVKDSTLDQTGTLVVFRRPKPKPKPKVEAKPSASKEISK